VFGGRTRIVIQISVGVLAGGLSRRMGRDKAFLPIGGRPVIQRVLDRVSQVSDDVIIVTNAPDRYRFCTACRLVGDVFPGKGSLGGIYTALTLARNYYCLIVACDMPFLSVSLLQHLVSLAPGYDVVVPRIADRLETTHAVYSTACLDAIRQQITLDDLRIRSFFDGMRVRVVEQTEVARYDAELRSFLNMNTPSDWERLQQLAAEQERAAR
jgi:molybdopterin-guanine dinucleotide biosynthesis protein A